MQDQGAELVETVLVCNKKRRYAEDIGRVKFKVTSQGSEFESGNKIETGVLNFRDGWPSNRDPSASPMPCIAGAREWPSV
jgi:hypothetical protein